MAYAHFYFRQNRLVGVQMKITFLGSSHGIPEANRRCSCTLIEVGENRYFIDMGMMAVEELVNRGIAVDSVKGVFITHMHGDHTNGLISFVDLCSWVYKTAEPKIFLPKIEGKEVILDWFKVTGTNAREFDFCEVRDGVIFDDGVLKVTAVCTKHCDVSFAYLLEAEGKNVLFTGDLYRQPEEDFPKIAREVRLDLAVCEGAHFDVEKYEPIFKECDIKRVIINHTAQWNFPHLQNLASKMPELGIKMANDGLEVIV